MDANDREDLNQQDNMDANDTEDMDMNWIWNNVMDASETHKVDPGHKKKIYKLVKAVQVLFNFWADNSIYRKIYNLAKIRPC